MKTNRRLFLDVHAIQTLPPSNVNRDDTGSPKTAQYGGVRRARVSSQSWKKAMRDYFLENGNSSNVGIRSKDWFKQLCKMFKQENQNMNDTEVLEKVAGNFAEALIVNNKKNRAKGVKTLKDKLIKNGQYDGLLFLSERQAQKFVDEITKDNIDKNILKNILSAEPSVDIALFGRMVADDPSLNEDASSQVAHAISTHAVQNEFDFYTAVDDLSKADNAGAGMLGNIEFNSSTLYRYANVAIHELLEQLESKEATVNTLKLFIEAFSNSLPTGKVNTFANQTLPQALVITIRDDRPINMVSAFEKPVKSTEGYVQKSIQKLFEEFKKVEKFVHEPLAVMYLTFDDMVKNETVGKEKNSLADLLEDFSKDLITLLNDYVGE